MLTRDSRTVEPKKIEAQGLSYQAVGEALIFLRLLTANFVLRFRYSRMFHTLRYGS